MKNIIKQKDKRQINKDLKRVYSQVKKGGYSAKEKEEAIAKHIAIIRKHQIQLQQYDNQYVELANIPAFIYLKKQNVHILERLNHLIKQLLP